MQNKKFSAPELSEGVRINKYMADSGMCSRREADRLVEEGKVYVDGKIYEDGYHQGQTTAMGGSVNYPHKVPDGCVFVMGDNRNASTDSRDMRVGTIREEYILGKAYFRMMPFGQFKIG